MSNELWLEVSPFASSKTSFDGADDSKLKIYWNFLEFNLPFYLEIDPIEPVSPVCSFLKLSYSEFRGVR